MPRIPQKILDCVCYLYKDEEHAWDGKEFGGTDWSPCGQRGFRKRYVYAVTNWHVACRGNSVIRINTKDGRTDIFPFGPEQWEFDPHRGADVAVAPLPLRDDLHRYALIPAEGFLSREDIDKSKLGPGEDVFMVGRFVDHDGGQVNSPAVRFGNISVMPTPSNKRQVNSLTVSA